MQTFLVMLHASTLLAIAWQDFRYRAVSWLLLVLCIAATAAEGWLLQGERLLPLAGINLALMLLQLLVLKIVFSIKNKQNTPVADTLLGWGDILFFVVPCLYFGVFHFVAFYVISLVLVLVGFLVWQGHRKAADAEIPLAGGMAVLMLWVRIPELLPVEYDRYQDHITQTLFPL